MNKKNQVQIEKAKQYASSKGGFCLSITEDYKNGNSILTWKCNDNNHGIWQATFRSVIHDGFWCQDCQKNQTTKSKENLLKEVQEFAKSKGGECLSNEYLNNKTPMIWRCGNATHKPWKTTFNAVKDQKCWCPTCAKEVQQINAPMKIKEAHEMAKKKNGQCLSTEYLKEDVLLEWKCHVTEHQSWKARFKNVVKQDQWCPECANIKNKTENRVRLFLETYFNFKLPNTKPLWNINPKTGRLLELDGYSEDHKIAFEHDGQHHFEHTLYSPSVPKEEFQIQLERDKAKKENCLKQGVKLISIPILDYSNRYKFFNLLRHVIKHCKEQDINISYTYSQIKCMKENFYLFDSNKNSELNYLTRIQIDKQNLFKNLNKYENINEILIYYQYALSTKNRIELRKIIGEFDSNHSLIQYNPYKVEYPELSVLKEMVKKEGYVNVGKKLGCSDVAVKKYIKRRDKNFSVKEK